MPMVPHMTYYGQGLDVTGALIAQVPRDARGVQDRFDTTERWAPEYRRKFESGSMVAMAPEGARIFRLKAEGVEMVRRVDAARAAQAFMEAAPVEVSGCVVGGDADNQLRFSKSKVTRLLRHHGVKHASQIVKAMDQVHSTNQARNQKIFYGR